MALRSLSQPGSSLIDQRPVGDGVPPVKILYHPSMKSLAEKIVEVTTSRLERLHLSEVNGWGGARSSSPSLSATPYRAPFSSFPRAQDQRKYRQVELCDCIRWDRFRDGWPNIFIDRVEEIAGRDGGCSG